MVAIFTLFPIVLFKKGVSQGDKPSINESTVHGLVSQRAWFLFEYSIMSSPTLPLFKSFSNFKVRSKFIQTTATLWSPALWCFQV